ncbi:cytoplasmic dynein 1 intermediate chain-like isoform X1 [Stomoxys calcitrans]|uniref:cytoplasmic dynein 1 intermediate chain-like isoform X1 n=1 Tax=Stomoxys calcitrans TaxID=35570 RepID=UPI0027E30466|nr:cytoplasmic dynein 1 intermediate chain-like isoform X1 [Stomoxys calcitrans]
MYGKKYEDKRAKLEAKLEAMRQERKQLEKEKFDRNEIQIRKNIDARTESHESFNEKYVKFEILPVREVASTLGKLKSEYNDNMQTTLDAINTQTKSVSEKLLKLSVSQIKVTDIQPKAICTETKSTQTKGSRILPERLVIKKSDDSYDEYMSQGGFGSKLPPGCMSPGLPKIELIMPAITPLDLIDEESSDAKELSEEEKEAIISSKGFQNAIKRIGRVMENVVIRNVDITREYVSAGDNSDEYNSKSQGRVSLKRVFFENEWSSNRCITDIDFSTHYTDLMIASYHINQDELLQPEGVVMTWNTVFQKPTPEHIFHASSAVTSVRFAKFNPHLILGGTYSGQIVIWDSRSPRRVPVQSTTLKCGAHVQPIQSLRVISTDSNDNIFSVSSDGRLCLWNLDMLSQPVDVLPLEKEQKRGVAVMCMEFTGNEFNELLVGSEDGCVYLANQWGTKNGVRARFGEHEAPITSISIQQQPEQHLFLTSSIDSTIKLWSLRHSNPLHTFQNNFEYVMDVAWSPINASLFATVDGGGHLDIWNINLDTEQPSVSIHLEGQPALNRVSWMPNGQHIAVGDIDGKLYLYDIDDHLAQPLAEDLCTFVDTICMSKQKVNYE